LLPEAERAVVDYAGHEPQNTQERFGMESLVADAFYHEKDYEHMASHAAEMFNAAKLLATKQIDSLKRDQMLAKAATFLTEAYLKLNQKDAALDVAKELRRLALSFPSGNLYKSAMLRLGTINPSLDQIALDEAVGADQ